MKDIGKAFNKFKNNLIEKSDIYLGAKLEEKVLNGKSMWSMTSKDYVKLSVENVERQLKKKNLKFPTRAVTPMMSDFIPELDASRELSPEDTTFYQELIGILRWAVEIGRVDILTELSLLSSYQASPRQGHLEQLIHIFAFLKKNPKLTLYFDPQEPILDPNMFVGNSPEAFKVVQ